MIKLSMFPSEFQIILHEIDFTFMYNHINVETRKGGNRVF